MSNLTRKLNELNRRIASLEMSQDELDVINKGVKNVPYVIEDSVSVQAYKTMDGDIVVDVYYYDKHKRTMDRIIEGLENISFFSDRIRNTHRDPVGTKIAHQLNFGKAKRVSAAGFRMDLEDLMAELRKTFGNENVYGGEFRHLRGDFI